MKLKELEQNGYEVVRKPNNHHVFVKFRCAECGKESLVRSDYIQSKSNICTSCHKKGNKNNLKHGCYKDRLYHIWLGMHRRNYNTYNPKVCDEWKSDFICFKTWAIENGYNDNLTIDRIDSSKDYEPSNCRWITLAENARRARQIFSKEEKLKYYQMRKDLHLTQVEMAIKLGVSRNTIQRLEREVKNESA